MMNNNDFSNYAEADAFADACEAQGHEHVTVLTNTPAVGQFRVNWGGNEADSSFSAVMADYGKMFATKEREANEIFDRKCNEAGALSVATAAAKAANLEGRVADVFVLAFFGHSIKHVDPASEGLLSTFQAGRAASLSSEGRRAVRVAAVEARSYVVRDPSFYSEGLSANGER